MDSNNTELERFRKCLIGANESQKKNVIDNLGEYKYFLSEVSDLKLKLLDKYNRLRFLQAKYSGRCPDDENTKKNLEKFDGLTKFKDEDFRLEKKDFANNCDVRQSKLLEMFEECMNAIYREARTLYNTHQRKF